MANFEDFLSNFPYPASYLASAHKDSSEEHQQIKKNCQPFTKVTLYLAYLLCTVWFKTW